MNADTTTPRRIAVASIAKPLSAEAVAVLTAHAMDVAAGTPFRSRLIAQAALAAEPALSPSLHAEIARQADPMAPVGWCILRTEAGVFACPVRWTGNLVDAGNPMTGAPTGMTVFGRQGEEANWPTIYATEQDAANAIDAELDACHHDWRVSSHEEAVCARCGAVKFAPDID